MKIIHIVGARPNFMKIAPMIRALKEYPSVQNILIHTGQHYDASMSDIFFTDLHLPKPDINLEVGSGSHAQQTAQVMMRFEPVLLEQKPDLVLVVGDVNSTMACSLVSVKLHIPVAHVEAGIRSFDRSMPEEINRIVTDTISDLLFTPHRDADANLRKEGIPEEKIFFVGNVMVDSLLNAANLAARQQAWKKWNLEPGNYVVLTLHRPSNVDDTHTLRRLVTAFIEIAGRLPVLFPVHPRTTHRLAEAGLEEIVRATHNLILTEPLGYLDFLSLISQAKMVLSDSGSIQAETTVLDVPCLTLRWNTEWPITLSQGTNVLVGTDSQRILEEAGKVLNGDKKLAARPEFWDGLAAQRIAEILVRN